MDSREEIKAKLPIFDLVSKYVELKKSGRNFKGLCPFHSEKTPSFMVSPEKDIAYCFGCHKGGDIFAFYQGVEGVEFPEALKALGEMVGVEVETSSPQISNEVKSKRSKLVDIHDIVADFYTDNLFDTSDGKKVLKYLYSRGLTDDTIKECRLGFSPDSYDKTYKYLLKKGFEKEEIVEAGIASTKGTDYSSIFDRFRLRLMFPILNKNGSVVAFGGRALKQDEAAKYLNSPETPIYHKSDVLYGFSFAKEYIRKERSVIVVEGYFDQLMCYQAGYKNVVGVSGTAMTPKHVALLKRYADTIYFGLDSDSAGREALYRSAELAYAAEMNVRVIDFGEYKDPAELINEEPDSFKICLENATEFFDFLIKEEFLSIEESKRFAVSSVNRFLEKALPIVNKIQSSISKDIVLRKLAQYLQTKVDFLYDELRNLKSFEQRTPKSSGMQAPEKKFDFSLEDYFWCNVLIHPSYYSKFRNLLIEKSFIVQEKQVYKSIEDFYNSADDFADIQIEDLDISDELKEKYGVLALYLESSERDSFEEDEIEKEYRNLFDRMLKNYKKVEGERIQRALTAAERESDKQEMTKLLEDYKKILSL